MNFALMEKPDKTYYNVSNFTVRLNRFKPETIRFIGQRKTFLVKENRANSQEVAFYLSWRMHFISGKKKKKNRIYPMSVLFDECR